MSNVLCWFFYNFDTSMNKDILYELIIDLESAGFPVVAIVSDLNPTNVRLWNSLRIITNNTFTNPAASDRQVFAFADLPPPSLFD